MNNSEGPTAPAPAGESTARSSSVPSFDEQEGARLADWATLPLEDFSNPNSDTDEHRKHPSAELEPILDFSPPPPPPPAAPASLKREVADTMPTGPTRRKKKPKSLPKRPLSAYNLFFKQERVKLNESKSGDKVGFDELGKIVGKKWRELSEEDRKIYQEMADRESDRYRTEMEQYVKRQEAQKKEQERTQQQRRNDDKSNHTHIISSSRLLPTSRFSQQPSAQPQMSPGPKYGPQGYGAGPMGVMPVFGGPPPPHYGRQGYGGPPPPYQSYGPTYNNCNNNTMGSPWNNNHNAPSFDNGFREYKGPENGSSPLAPGTEVQLHDDQGILRTYTVQYTTVTMSRQEAKKYLDSLQA